MPGQKIRIFRETEVRTDCDACGAFFDMVKGGVCDKCRRILCSLHLHGSFARRLLAEITRRSVCTECRHAG